MRTISAHHIVVGIEKQASGLTYAIPKICKALSEQKVDIELHVTSKKLDEDFPFKVNTYPQSRLSPKELGLSPKMYKSLKDLGKQANIVHNHSLWTMPNVYAGWIGKNSNHRMIFSPHGTLSTWSLNRSKWKKKLFWHLGQKSALKHSFCFHVTAKSEYEDIRRLGFQQPVAIIPLGIDLPLNHNHLFTKKKKQVLFLARIHPKKGVELLLKVWNQLQDIFTDWNLVIAGPEDVPGYLLKLETYARKNCKRVEFVGPIFEERKRKTLEESLLYVLPTHSENFGITVAEALGAGMPAIVSKGAPWEGLESNGCGWWIDLKESELKAAMKIALSKDKAELIAMGQQGYLWIERDYSWNKVGVELKQTYEWMLEPSTKPPSFIIRN